MPQTYMRTWPGSIGVKRSVARVSVLWMRSVMQRGACFAPRAASRIAARRAFGIVCVPYNRFSIAALPSVKSTCSGAARALPSTDAIQDPRRRVASLAAALRGHRVPARAATAEELSEVTRLHRAGQSGRRARACRSRPRRATQGRADALPQVGGPRRRRPGGRSAGDPAAARAGLPRARRAAQQPGRALRRAPATTASRAPSSRKRIRLNPGYAPAHENLGDVHALLAAQSYARALRLEPASATLPRKLALVRQLTAISSEPKAAPPQPAARPASTVRR